jgi:hypothetical protein
VIFGYSFEYLVPPGNQEITESCSKSNTDTTTEEMTEEETTAMTKEVRSMMTNKETIDNSKFAISREEAKEDKENDTESNKEDINTGPSNNSNNKEAKGTVNKCKNFEHEVKKMKINLQARVKTINKEEADSWLLYIKKKKMKKSKHYSDHQSPASEDVKGPSKSMHGL